MVEPDKLKVGDTIQIDGEEAIVISVTPAINEDCEHEWVDGELGEPEYCSKCGLSFIRYIFSCCP